ncbi:MAG: DUF5615 family PIN-like protein [Treponema sp.]|nr:DUF5615 family PIN-like protein [Treponema sp.]
MSEHFVEQVQYRTSKTGKDTEIWNYAAVNGYTIITQDSDFLYLFETKGFLPKVILLRAGKIDIKTADKILLQTKPSILDLGQGNYRLLEII